MDPLGRIELDFFFCARARALVPLINIFMCIFFSLMKSEIVGHYMLFCDDRLVVDIPGGSDPSQGMHGIFIFAILNA